MTAHTVVFFPIFYKIFQTYKEMESTISLAPWFNYGQLLEYVLYLSPSCPRYTFAQFL